MAPPGASTIDKARLEDALVFVDVLDAAWPEVGKDSEQDEPLSAKVVTTATLQWSDLTAAQLRDALLAEQHLRTRLIFTAPTIDRQRRRADIVRRILNAASARVATVSSQASQRNSESGDAASQPASSRGSVAQAKEALSPEQRFLGLATRSLVTTLFAFLQQAADNETSDLIDHLLEDASLLVAELPLASLQEAYEKPSAQSSWRYTIDRTFEFSLSLVSRHLETGRHDLTQAALSLAAGLAAQTGSLKLFLRLTNFLASLSSNRTFDMSSFISKLREFRRCSSTEPTESVPGSIDAAAPTAMEVQNRAHPQELAGKLLSKLADLMPRASSDSSKPAVYVWGKFLPPERGAIASELSLKKPTESECIAVLEPTLVVAGVKATYVVDHAGQLYSAGQAGDGDRLGKPDAALGPVAELTGARVVALAASSHILCATADGKVFSWGNNSYKQLGRSGSRSQPGLVSALTHEHIVRLATGGSHSAAISADGKLYTWGKGAYGRLGHGNSEDVAQPTLVHALIDVHIVDVACGHGDAHTLAVSKAGHVYSWGDGDNGKLGHGSIERYRTPQQIRFEFDQTGIAKVWCGNQTSFALTNGGALYAWGSCTDGALGNGRASDYVSSPERILENHQVTEFSVYGQGCLAITHEGRVLEWGRLHTGEIVAEPRQVIDLPPGTISQVSVGRDHRIAWTGPKTMSGLVQGRAFMPPNDLSCLGILTNLVETTLARYEAEDAETSALSSLQDMLLCSLAIMEAQFNVSEQPSQSVDMKTCKELLLGLCERHHDAVKLRALSCLLQGWEVLEMREEDRVRILELIQDILFSEGAEQDSASAKEVFQSKWRYLLPKEQRLELLSKLVTESLSGETGQPHMHDFSSSQSTTRHVGRNFFVDVIVSGLLQDGEVETMIARMMNHEKENQSGADVDADAGAEGACDDAPVRVNRQATSDDQQPDPRLGQLLEVVCNLLKTQQQDQLGRALSRAAFGSLLSSCANETISQDESKAARAECVLQQVARPLFLLVGNMFAASLRKTDATPEAVQQLLSASSTSLFVEMLASIKLMLQACHPSLSRSIVVLVEDVSLLDLLKHVSRLAVDMEALQEPSADQTLLVTSLVDIGSAAAALYVSATLMRYLAPNFNPPKTIEEFGNNPIFAGGTLTSSAPDSYFEFLLASADLVRPHIVDSDTLTSSSSPQTGGVSKQLIGNLKEFIRNFSSRPVPPLPNRLWPTIICITAALARHFGMNGTDLQQALELTNVDSISAERRSVFNAIADGLVAAIRTIPRLTQTDDEPQVDVITLRIQDICTFLAHNVTPASAFLQRKSAIAARSRWRNSRRRVISLGLEHATEDDSRRPMAFPEAVMSLSHEEPQQAESPVEESEPEHDLDVLLSQDDWRGLVQEVAQMSWLLTEDRPTDDPSASPVSWKTQLCKNLIELVFAFATDPISITKLQEYFDAQQEIAHIRVASLQTLRTLLDIPLHSSMLMQVLRSMTIPEIAGGCHQTASVFSRLTSLPVELRQALSLSFNHVLDRAMNAIKRGITTIEEAEPGSPVVRSQLQLLHCAVSFIFQRLELESIDHVLEQDMLSLIQRLQHALERRAILEHDGTSTQPEADASPAGLTPRSQSTGALHDDLESITSSSNGEALANLFNDSDQTWQSDGRRDEHAILFKMRPGKCIRRLAVTASFGSSFQPMRIKVYGGAHENQLKHLRTVDCQAERNGSTVELLSNVMQYFRYFKLLIAAVGINVRIKQLHIEAPDAAALDGMSVMGYEVPCHKLSHFLLLTASCQGKRLSTKSVDSLSRFLQQSLMALSGATPQSVESLTLRLLLGTCVRMVDSTSSLAALLSSDSWLNTFLQLLQLDDQQVGALLCRLMTAIFAKSSVSNLNLEAAVHSLMQIVATPFGTVVSDVQTHVIRLLRKLHAVSPPWRTEINAFIARQLDSVLATRDADSCGATFSLLGYRAHAAFVGSIVEHEQRGRMTVLEVSDGSITRVYNHAVDVEEAADKSLSDFSLEPCEPFHFVAAAENDLCFRLLRQMMLKPRALPKYQLPITYVTNELLKDGDFLRVAFESCGRGDLRQLWERMQHAVSPLPVLNQLSQDEMLRCALALQFGGDWLPLLAASNKSTMEDRPYETVEVSSGTESMHCLLDGSPYTVWTSSGTQGTHWIRFTMQPDRKIQKLVLLCSSGDGTFMPSKVNVAVGDSPSSLSVLRTHDIQRDTSSVTLLGELAQYHRVIQINILRCQQGGYDTKIRGIELHSQPRPRAVHSAGVDSLRAAPLDEVRSWQLSLSQQETSDKATAEPAATSTSGPSDQSPPHQLRRRRRPGSYMDNLLNLASETVSSSITAGLRRASALEDQPQSPDRTSLTSSDAGADTLRVESAGSPLVYAWGSDAERCISRLCSEPVTAAGRHAFLPRKCDNLPFTQPIADMAIVRERVAIVTNDGKLFVGAEGDVELLRTDFDVKAVSLGAQFMIVLDTNGRVYSCGKNEHGCLGRGMSEAVLVPELQRVEDLDDIVAISCGRSHCAAVASDGRTFVWGYNHSGRLGLGDELDRLSPTPLDNVPPMRSVACGERHTLFLSNEGQVFACGTADSGRLGLCPPAAGQASIDQLTPVQIPGLTNVVKVVNRFKSCAALTGDGKVFVWGAGRDDRLGVGAADVVSQPMLIAALSQLQIVDISLGHEHGAAVTASGLVYTWGSNVRYQTGSETVSAAVAPRVVQRLSSVRVNRVECGARCTFAWLVPDTGLSATSEPDLWFTTVGRLDTADTLGAADVHSPPHADLLGPWAETQEKVDLVALASSLRESDSAETAVGLLLDALDVSTARQLSLWCVYHDLVSLTELPADPQLVMLMLLDLLRLTGRAGAAARHVSSDVFSAEKCQKLLKDALNQLLQKDEGLVSHLAPLTAVEAQRLSSDWQRGVDMKGASSQCPSNVVQSDWLLLDMGSVEVLQLLASEAAEHCSPSCPKIGTALGSLWITSRTPPLKKWAIEQLHSLLAADGEGSILQLVHSCLRDEKLVSGSGFDVSLDMSVAGADGNRAVGTFVVDQGRESPVSSDDEQGPSCSDVSSSSGNADTPVESDVELTPIQLYLLLARVSEEVPFSTFRHHLSEVVSDAHEGPTGRVLISLHLAVDHICIHAGANPQEALRQALFVLYTTSGHNRQEQRMLDAVFRDACEAEDAEINTIMSEFARVLWYTVIRQYECELDGVRSGKYLLHTTYMRDLVAVAATLGLIEDAQHLPSKVTGSSELALHRRTSTLSLVTVSSQSSPDATGRQMLVDSKMAWYHRYLVMGKVMSVLAQRQPFPSLFINMIKDMLRYREASDGGNPSRPSEAEQRTSAAHASERTTPLDCFDNETFSSEMDRQLIEWLSDSPQDLKLQYVPRASRIQQASLAFHEETHVVGDGTSRNRALAVSNEGRTVEIKTDGSEENTWIFSNTVFTSGVHYWAIRCDAKGAARRYVGVGVGKMYGRPPAGTARLLSDGNIKSASFAQNLGRGFDVGDVVGVLLDLDQFTIAFDVNGVKRGEVALPDVVPGDAIRPLLYLFTPGDKFSVLPSAPVPPCYGGSSASPAYYRALSDVAMYERPDSATVMGILPNGSVVICHELSCQPSGVWLRLHGLERLITDHQASRPPSSNASDDEQSSGLWCRLQAADGSTTFEQATAPSGAMPQTVLNPSAVTHEPAMPESSDDVPDPEEEAALAEGFSFYKCVAKTSKNAVFAAPDLVSIEVGSISPGTRLLGKQFIVDGIIWVQLHPASKQKLCFPTMIHLDAFMPLKRGGQPLLEVEQAKEEAELEIRSEYHLLEKVPSHMLKQRAFILEYTSNQLVQLIPLLTIRPQFNAEQGLGLGCTQQSLSMLQSYMLLSHKERILKSVLQRTMATDSHRPTITLNRVQIKREPGGLAGPEGRQSVFAQACRELKSLSDTDLLSATRVWKVKFLGEGVDDAGGGYSESISEMCDELVNGSLPLLIRTPNGREDTGNNRDVFVFSPNATSPFCLELFEFLGVIIGIAIRTSSPISLPLADAMWQLLTGLDMTLGNLAEIDTSYVHFLEFLRGLPNDPDLFEEYQLPTTTPGADGERHNIVEGSFLESHQRDDYVQRSIEFRCHEFDQQAAAVRRGMARVVPLPIVSLFTREQLRCRVCGSQDFDLDLLRSMTQYRGASSTSCYVEWFWWAMEALTLEERNLFLRFVWGRTRLPTSEEDFGGRHFTLQVLDRYPPGSPEADGALPEALTCFFVLKVPPYSSREVLLDKLRYAFRFCKAIDTDNYARVNLAEGEEIDA